MASALYNNYKKLIFSGNVQPVPSGCYVMLVSGTYNTSATLTSNLANHTHTGDLANTPSVSYEVVDPLGSYTRGGKALTGKTASVVGTAGVFDADDISWASSTITASGAVIYQSGTTPAASYLIAWLDFGADQTSTNGTFSIVWNNPNGIVNIA
jgi:hypothetical protein